jgi:hypothetical protein
VKALSLLLNTQIGAFCFSTFVNNPGYRAKLSLGEEDVKVS